MWSGAGLVRPWSGSELGPGPVLVRPDPWPGPGPTVGLWSDRLPTRAARSFFEGRPKSGVAPEDRTLTVMMLGLSFLGQPFASLGVETDGAV